jgi:hypothetical protein
MLVVACGMGWTWTAAAGVELNVGLADGPATAVLGGAVKVGEGDAGGVRLGCGNGGIADGLTTLAIGVVDAVTGDEVSVGAGRVVTGTGLDVGVGVAVDVAPGRRPSARASVVPSPATSMAVAALSTTVRDVRKPKPTDASPHRPDAIDARFPMFPHVRHDF